MLISKLGKELGKKNYNKLGPIISKYNPPKLNVNKFYKNEFKFYNVPQNEQTIANMKIVKDANQNAKEFVKKFKNEIELEQIKIKQEEDAKSYLKKITEKLTNKTLIANILTVLSFSALVHFNIKSEKISIVKTIEKEKTIEEEKKIINILFDFIIKKIKNINNVLYNTLKYTFNIFIRLPNISYNYIKLILQNITKITDTNTYIDALNNLNILCNNIIITSTNETKKIINNISLTVNNFARLIANKTGDLAIYNLNIFLKLLRLPSVNKEELLNNFKQYTNYLELELIIFKTKQLFGIKDVPKSQFDILRNNLNNLYEGAKDYFTENFNIYLKSQEEIANKNNDSFINKILSFKNPLSQKVVDKYNKSNSNIKDYLYFQINNILEKNKNNNNAIIKDFQYLLNIP